MGYSLGNGLGTPGLHGAELRPTGLGEDCGLGLGLLKLPVCCNCKYNWNH